MKKLGYFKKSLLMSAVALSVLSSPANAVSEEEVKEYLGKNFESQEIDSNTLKHLVDLNDEQWKQFQRIAQLLITSDMNAVTRGNLIPWLCAVTSAKLYNEKFVSLVESVMNKTEGQLDHSQMSLNYALDMLSLKAERRDEAMLLADRGQVLMALSLVPSEKLLHDKFASIVLSFITPEMNGEDRFKVINSLGNLKAEILFDDRFVSVVKALSNPEMNGLDCSRIILTFWDAKSERLFHEGFLPTTHHLLTPNMDVEKRFWVINALSHVKHPETAYNDKFVSAVQSLIGPNMTGEDICRVMVTLGRVDTYRSERVYSQIERFISETQGKLQLTGSQTKCGFITALLYSIDDISDQSSLFTTSLIQLVNSHEGNVNDDALLTHMNTAWQGLGRVSPLDIQALARQGNVSSTTKDDDLNVRRGLAPQVRSEEQGS